MIFKRKKIYTSLQTPNVCDKQAIKQSGVILWSVFRLFSSWCFCLHFWLFVFFFLLQKKWKLVSHNAIIGKIRFSLYVRRTLNINNKSLSNFLLKCAVHMLDFRHKCDGCPNKPMEKWEFNWVENICTQLVRLNGWSIRVKCCRFFNRDCLHSQERKKKTQNFLLVLCSERGKFVFVFIFFDVNRKLVLSIGNQNLFQFLNRWAGVIYHAAKCMIIAIRFE